MAGQWLDAVPRSSQEAARWARRALAWSLAVFAVSIGASAVAVLALGVDDLGLLPPLGLVGTALCTAAALVHRETYHRLRDQGR